MHNFKDYLDTTAIGWNASTDVTPYFNSLTAQIKNTTGRGVIYFPAGTYRFKAQPNADTLSGVTVIGDGSMATTMIYDNNSGFCFPFNGANGYTGGGCKGMAILLENGYPLSTSYAIGLEGNATYQPDQTNWDDLYISSIGNSYWFGGVRVNGSARTHPQGVRVANWTNIQIFRCRGFAGWFNNIVQWTFHNIGTYAGIGGGNNFYITGEAGDTLKQSTLVHITGAVISGQLNLTNCSRWIFTGSTTQVGTNTTCTNGVITVIGQTTYIGAFGAGVKVI